MQNNMDRKTIFFRPSVKSLFVRTIVILVICTVFLPQSTFLSKNLALGKWLDNPTVGLAASGTDWTQDGHDAQRTGYTVEEPAEPWSLAWTWNGPDASGGGGGHLYNAPKDARTITGGNNVYVPAGAAGMYGLGKSDGKAAWHLTMTAFNATPAYDPATGYLYAGGRMGSCTRWMGRRGMWCRAIRRGGR